MGVKYNKEKIIEIKYSPETLKLLKEQKIPFETWEFKNIIEDESEIIKEIPLIAVSETIYQKLKQIAAAFNITLEKLVEKIMEKDIEYIKLNVLAKTFEEIIMYYETELDRNKLAKIFTGDKANEN